MTANQSSDADRLLAAATTPGSVPILPERFGQLTQLAQGGQGGVWVGHSERAGKLVFKEIATEVGAGARAVFACLRDLASPHLPAVEEVVDSAQGGTWLVTRYVEGESLCAGPAPLVEVLGEAVQLAHALAALHAAGTHHADVAPKNVLRDASGRVTMTDLGSLGAKGFGTPGFIAPECLRGGGGPASDVFSLGSLMLWRVCGESPWPDAASLSQLRRPAQVQHRVSQLLHGAGAYPDTLLSLLCRMLAPDPTRRVPDAKTLLPVLARLKQWAGQWQDGAGSSNATRSGAARRTAKTAPELISWWPPARWPFFGALKSRVEALGRAFAGRDPDAKIPRLVLVAGPSGSGRSRVCEELVAVAQQAGAALRAETSEAFDTPLGRAGSKECLPGAVQPGAWLESWLSHDEMQSDQAQVRVCVQEVAWPARFEAGDGEGEDLDRLRAAVLLAGARLSPSTRVIIVSTRLADYLEESGASEIEVLRVSALSRQASAELLTPMIEGPGAQPWLDRLFALSGGWPAALVRWVQACADVAAQDPSHDCPAQDQLAQGADMHTSEARSILARAWGAQVSLPARWVHADQVLPWAYAQAKAVLGEETRPWALQIRSSLQQDDRRAALSLALELGDDATILAWLETRTRDESELEPALMRWVCEQGTKLAFEHRALAIEQLLGHGRNEEALALCGSATRLDDAGKKRGVSNHEGTHVEALAFRARALQRLGRAAEGLDLLRSAAALDPRLLGLGWRALIDLGRGEEIEAEVRTWWSREQDGAHSTLSLGQLVSPEARGVAILWGAMALMHSDPTLAEEMLSTLLATLRRRPGRESAGLRARASQLQGNLAHLRGQTQRVREAYTAALEDFRRAGESSAKVWIEGNLCALAVPAGEVEQALLYARRSVRTLLAHAQLQALPGAVWNAVEALVRVEAFDEAEVMVDSAMQLSRAADLGRGELMLLDACRAQLALQRSASRGELESMGRAAAELAELAARLEECGHEREACAAWLHDAAARRVMGRPESSKASRLRAQGLAGQVERHSGEKLLGLECVLEELDYVRAFKTGPAWGDSLERAAARLSEFAGPESLRRSGQLELAFRYDRTLLRALFRLHGAAHPACRALRRRALEALEEMMTKTPPNDRPALRSYALNDHGDRGALSELLSGLVDDAQSGAAHTNGVTPSVAGDTRVLALATPGEPDGASIRGAGQEQRATQLLRMYRRLAREEDLDRLLASVCDVMMELTDAERGVVVVCSGDARHEVLREFSNEADAPSFSRSIIERVLKEGQPLLSVDATEDERFDGASSISHLNLRSVIAVPLRFRGERLGAAYVDHRLRRGAFGEEDLSLMEDFGDLAALAVAQTRALTEARAKAEELERHRATLEAQLDERDVEVLGLREQVRNVRDERESYRGMVGRAPAMQKLYRLIDRLAGSEVPVVIHGESGTGKELVARALHEAGPRAPRPFIAENCGAVPESLLESLFFGHARGAFTGANQSKAGLIEAADGGTIFLDEIGEMSMGMQTKLLRVLQEGEVRRVGETKTRKVDVRVVAASNRDLEQMVEAGSFRRDLFYRINVVRLELPALRERSADIPALVAHFVANSGRPELELSGPAKRQLLRYAWPGNVRELENEVQRWIALVEDKVQLDDLAPAIAGAQGEVIDPDDLTLKTRIDHLERELIAQALTRTRGNQTRAAELLGMSRYGLQKKIKRHQAADAGDSTKGAGSSGKKKSRKAKRDVEAPT